MEVKYVLGPGHVQHGQPVCSFSPTHTEPNFLSGVLVAVQQAVAGLEGRKLTKANAICAAMENSPESSCTERTAHGGSVEVVIERNW